MRDLVVLRVAVPDKVLLEFVFNVRGGVLQAVRAGRVSRGPELSGYADVSLIIRQIGSLHRAVVDSDDRSVDLLIRNGLRAGERVLLTRMG